MELGTCRYTVLCLWKTITIVFDIHRLITLILKDDIIFSMTLSNTRVYVDHSVTAFVPQLSLLDSRIKVLSLDLEAVTST